MHHTQSECRWISATEETVVQTLERDVVSIETLLDPFVAVEAELYRVREIGADLEKGWSPVAIVNVKVIMIDGNRLSGEVESYALALS